jgi:serine/threonine-protein kinase
MTSPQAQGDGDSRASVRRSDQECDRFEAACKAGRRPRIEDHLAAVPDAERPALLRELILLEVDYRLLAGERPAADEFLARFPTVGRDWLAAVLRQTAVPERAPAPANAGGTANQVPTVPASQWIQPAAGAGPEPAGELQALLRTRLRFISLVVFAIYAYVLSVFLREIDATLRYWIYTPPYFLACFTSAALAAILWRKRPLSMWALRAIELTLFGLVLAQLAIELVIDLLLTPQFVGVAPWANTAAESGHYMWLYGNYASVPYVLLIVGYGTLIPSTWRRCGLVVGVMAATPLTISLAACIWTVAAPGAFLLTHGVAMGINLSIAVGIAVYGTRRIELLRRQAVAARKLGQYHLKQLLGRGGMGEVYLAEHVLLKQPCAIKLIRPERAGDSATLRRFEREVRATARLRHWNTVRIFDYGRAADGTFYYVMEYLAGATLEQLVKQHGPLPPGRAVHVLRQACLALREAHALGLVHRDIKPANFILCELGGVADVVKVLDFGLVKAVGLDGQQETLTQEGVIAGTPAYMAPEQAAGAVQLDGRADIYSLGAVAYFLLTGQPPFQRDRAVQLLVAHIHEPVRPMTELRPEVPADLQAVVLRCLEKDPGRRFADAGGLLDALAGCACAGS